MSERVDTFLGVPKLPARFAGVVMPLLLSVLMTFIVSFISTYKSIGFAPQFAQIWMGAWGMSWLVAFPTTLVVLPFVRKITMAVVRAA
jgi:hypothetical protein